MIFDCLLNIAGNKVSIKFAKFHLGYLIYYAMPEYTHSPFAIFAGVLFGVLVLCILVGWLLGQKQSICPNCNCQSLRCVQWIRATVMIDGQRAPASWCYFLCESCGARYKQHLKGDFEIPSEAEWTQYC